MIWYAFWGLGAQCRLQEAHSRWKDFTFGGFVESNMDGRKKCKNPARRSPKWTKMRSKWIQDPTKPFEILNTLLKICKIQAQIKQNVILECFGGSWGAGSAKGCPQPLAGLHMFRPFCGKLTPNCWFGSHFGTQIGPKTMQKQILKSMPKNCQNIMTKWWNNLEHCPKLNATFKHFLDKLFFEKHVFSLVLQWFL